MPLSVVKARDPKGLYAKVAKGQIKNFTGVDAPYEAPLTPEVTLKTHELPIEQSVDILIAALRSCVTSPFDVAIIGMDRMMHDSSAHY